MDKPVFLDYETKIYAAYLNAVAATVWDALGEATNPQEARQFIGAIGEAPTDGSSYARQNAQWVQIQVGNLHNDLTGRSAPDAHPVSAITGLQESLDQINLDIAGKAPASAGTAAGTSFSPSGTVAATNVQSAIAEVDGDVTALQATVAGLGTPAASAVTFSPTGTVAATNVQAAIAEVASEKVALSGGTMTGPLTTTALTSNGQIESKATGIKFPDATVQASAARPVTKGAFVNLPAAPTYTVAIPAGKQSITAYLSLAAIAGANPTPSFRIGTISAIANTGYSGCYWRSAHLVAPEIGFDTTGVLIFSNTTSASVTGKLELTLMDAATNTWNFEYSGRTSDGFLTISNGTCVIPGELRQLQLLSFSGENFTGGRMSVDWN